MDEQSLIGLWVTSMVFQVISFILHGFGIYLIKSLITNIDNKVQYIFILSLSITEILTTIGLSVITTSDLITVLYRHKLDYVITMASTVLHTFNSILLYGNMAAIVVDKALGVWLNIKYSLYCTEKRAKYFELGLITVSIIVCIISLLATKLIKTFDHRIPYALYFRPIADVLFILCVATCYGYIFKRYLLSQRSNPSTPNSSVIQESLCDVFWKSRFLLSIGLAVTYIAFIIVPDFLQVYLMQEDLKQKRWLAARVLLYSIAFTSDALLYIFLDRNITELLGKKFRCLRRRNSYFQSRDAVRNWSSSTQVVNLQLDNI